MNKKKSVWKSMQFTSSYLSSHLPQIAGEYDIAISFQGIPFYMKNVKAKKKMAWIHTDYDTLHPDEKLDKRAYNLVDYIVTVSNQCKVSFDKKYPELKYKSIMIENIISDSVQFLRPIGYTIIQRKDQDDRCTEGKKGNRRSENTF